MAFDLLKGEGRGRGEAKGRDRVVGMTVAALYGGGCDSSPPPSPLTCTNMQSSPFPTMTPSYALQRDMGTCGQAR